LEDKLSESLASCFEIAEVIETGAARSKENAVAGLGHEHRSLYSFVKVGSVEEIRTSSYPLTCSHDCFLCYGSEVSRKDY
jgi:hypothetical protein